jgi:hypothetical protein
MNNELKKMKKQELIEYIKKILDESNASQVESITLTSELEEYKQMMTWIVPGYISYRDQLVALAGLLSRSVKSIESNDELLKVYNVDFGENNLFLKEKAIFDKLVEKTIKDNKYRKDSFDDFSDENNLIIN